MAIEIYKEDQLKHLFAETVPVDIRDPDLEAALIAHQGKQVRPGRLVELVVEAVEGALPFAHPDDRTEVGRWYLLALSNGQQEGKYATAIWEEDFTV